MLAAAETHPDAAHVRLRDVRLAFEDRQVLRGLSEGDRVVTSANFLLDSESSLKAALASMGSPSP